MLRRFMRHGMDDSLRVHVDAPVDDEVDNVELWGQLVHVCGLNCGRTELVKKILN